MAILVRDSGPVDVLPVWQPLVATLDLIDRTQKSSLVLRDLRPPERDLRVGLTLDVHRTPEREVAHGGESAHLG